MSGATRVSDLEAAEHLGYADSKGVKRVSVFNDGVQVGVATEAKQDDIVSALTENLATLWATKSTDSTIIYVGEAAIGSLSNSASWRIQEINTTNGTIKWADGNSNFDNNFTNRESLIYS